MILLTRKVVVRETSIFYHADLSQLDHDVDIESLSPTRIRSCSRRLVYEQHIPHTATLLQEPVEEIFLNINTRQRKSLLN